MKKQNISTKLEMAYSTIRSLEEKAQKVRDVIIFAKKPCVLSIDRKSVIMPIDTYEKLINEMNK